MSHERQFTVKQSAAALRRFRSRILCLLLVLPSQLGLSGCGIGLVKGYDGPARSDKELAIVRPQGVTIHSINGINVGNFHSGATVLPGANNIDLTIDESNFNGKDRDPHLYHIKFEAIAGRSYAITGQRGDGRLCAFPIEDKSGSPDFRSPAGCLTR